MIIDKQNLFSEDQAVTASAVSTNVIDLGAEGTGTPSPNLKDAELFVQVTEAFATLTSLTVALQTDSAEGFGTVETVLQSAAIPVASLLVGYKFKLRGLPEGLSRYVRLNYTVAGSNASAGKIFAGLVLGSQTKQ
jgi:hypothetical protein